MKITPLLIMIFGCFFATAQLKNFAVSVSSNYTAINGNSTYVTAQSYNAGYYAYTNTYGLKQTFTGKVGLDVSAKLDYYFSKRFFVSTGASASYLRFNKNLEVLVKDMNQPSNFSTYTTPGITFGSIYGSSNTGNNEVVTLGKPRTDKTTLYLSVPVMIGTSFFNEKLLIRTGAAISYLVNATQYVTSYSFSTQTLNQEKEHSTKGYNSLLAGTTIQSTYRVTKFLGVDISYQHSFTPIYTQTKSRYNTFALGLSYNIGF